MTSEVGTGEALGAASGSDPAGDVAADAADKTVAAVLGETLGSSPRAWLMSQSAEHKHQTMADLEWMAMPAILLRQFRLFYRQGRPVAVVLYARASEAVAARVAAGETRLEPAEWRSGEQVVVVQTIAPFAEGSHLTVRTQSHKQISRRYLCFESH